MDRTGGYIDFEFVAEFYDFVVPYQNRPDIQFFVDAAVESKGPVLEIGCGTGRVLIPIARKGIEITGLDLSPNMLKICRKNLALEPKEVQSRVNLVEADMCRFNLPQKFALVTTPFRPFQHLLTVKDQISCLECIHKHLADKGRMILDIFNPSLDFLTADNLGEEMGEDPESVLPDGRKVIRKYGMVNRDYFNQINYVEIIYYIEHLDHRKERLVHAFPMRYLFRYEAEHLLKRCGFNLLEVYADFDRKPYGSKYPGDLIMIAEKA